MRAEGEDAPGGVEGGGGEKPLNGSEVPTEGATALGGGAEKNPDEKIQASAVGVQARGGFLGTSAHACRLSGNGKELGRRHQPPQVMLA